MANKGYPLDRKSIFIARTLAFPPTRGNFGGDRACAGQPDIHKRCG
jgi:hypothetical protein